MEMVGPVLSNFLFDFEVSKVVKARKAKDVRPKAVKVVWTGAVGRC